MAVRSLTRNSQDSTPLFLLSSSQNGGSLLSASISSGVTEGNTGWKEGPNKQLGGEENRRINVTSTENPNFYLEMVEVKETPTGLLEPPRLKIPRPQACPATIVVTQYSHW